MVKQVKRKDIPHERRKEIMVAAAELFANSGYHGVSVNAIAKRAGISKGNLYWHFRSKQEIFHQLFEYLAGSLFLPLVQGIEEDNSPRKKLCVLTRRCLDTAEANPEVVRFGWQIAAQPELKGMLTSQYSEWMEPFIEQLVPIFTELGESNPEDIARFFALTLDAFMGMRVMMPEMMEKEKILIIIEERFINFTGENDD